MCGRRFWRVVLLLSLLAAALLNAGLAWLVREQYRGMVRVRLDPTSAARFDPLNAELKPRVAGEKRMIFLGALRMDMWRVLPTVEGCQMVNRGQSHDTSSQARLRLSRDVIALKPDVVFLEIGVNDLKSIGALPNDERAIIDRLKSNRSAILDELTGHGIQVIVSTIFPFGDVSLTRRPIWSDRILTARDEINQEIRQSNRPVVTVFDADTLFAVDGRMKAEYQLDELHLNEEGYRVLNQALEPIIERIVRPAGP